MNFLINFSLLFYERPKIGLIWSYMEKICFFEFFWINLLRKIMACHRASWTWNVAIPRPCLVNTLSGDVDVIGDVYVIVDVVFIISSWRHCNWWCLRHWWNFLHWWCWHDCRCCWKYVVVIAPGASVGFTVTVDVQADVTWLVCSIDQNRPWLRFFCNHCYCYCRWNQGYWWLLAFLEIDMIELWFVLLVILLSPAGALVVITV